MIYSLLPIRHTIVATGGGTFIDPEIRAAINADGVSVWIDAPFDVLLDRIPADGRRPLASDRVQMTVLYETRGWPTSRRKSVSMRLVRGPRTW